MNHVTDITDAKKILACKDKVAKIIGKYSSVASFIKMF